MNIDYQRVTSEEELRQILILQQKNLLNRVSASEKSIEGFVTVSHTFSLLQEMNTVCPHIIAKDGAKVVGYALCMHPNFSNAITILKPMFKEIARAIGKEVSYMVMGQVCIDKAYRQQGVFRQLYATMENAIKPEFDYIITEVDALNKRSLGAHYAVGFQDIKSYFSGEKEWKLIWL